MWHFTYKSKYVEFYPETCDLQTGAGAWASIHKPHPQAGLQPTGQTLQVAVEPDSETGIQPASQALQIAKASLRVDTEAGLPLHSKGMKTVLVMVGTVNRSPKYDGWIKS